MATRTHDLSIRYPDVSVFCNDRRGDEQAKAFNDPRILIEILSAGTARTDLRIKLDEYKAIDGVDTIIFVDTATERLRIVQRTAAHCWTDDEYDDAIDAPLPSLDIAMPHDEIFARD